MKYFLLITSLVLTVTFPAFAESFTPNATAMWA